MSRFSSFRAFYPFYLQEHSNRTSRRLHFIGSCGVLLLLLTEILRSEPRWLLAALVCGYGFAWVGHFFFEKNRPATFRHPLYSFAGDWVMFVNILRGRIPFWAHTGACLYSVHWSSKEWVNGQWQLFSGDGGGAVRRDLAVQNRAHGSAGV